MAGDYIRVHSIEFCIDSASAGGAGRGTRSQGSKAGPSSRGSLCSKPRGLLYTGARWQLVDSTTQLWEFKLPIARWGSPPGWLDWLSETEVGVHRGTPRFRLPPL